MLYRKLVLSESEFFEVLELRLTEKDSRGIYYSLCRIRIPIREMVRPLDFCYSVECSGRGYGYVSKEVFHLKNFLELEDWREKLGSYDDFVLGCL